MKLPQQALLALGLAASPTIYAADMPETETAVNVAVYLEGFHYDLSRACMDMKPLEEHTIENDLMDTIGEFGGLMNGGKLTSGLKIGAIKSPYKEQLELGEPTFSALYVYDRTSSGLNIPRAFEADTKCEKEEKKLLKQAARSIKWEIPQCKFWTLDLPTIAWDYETPRHQTTAHVIGMSCWDQSSQK